MRFTIGADIGSTAVKAVIFNIESHSVIDTLLTPTGWNPKEAAREAVSGIIAKNSLLRSDIARTVATGYGRNIAEADSAITEITCHAAGVKHMFKNVRTILDIGGQDIKTISIDRDGNVADFLMNDKCAAGTGRFLQNMAVMLESDISDFDRIPEDTPPYKISSMCTVFAESELVGLLVKGIGKDSLAMGVLDSVASKAEGMIRRVGMRAPLAFTGGVSKSLNLVKLLEKRLEEKILFSDMSQFAGAIGAAAIAARNISQM